jgi:phenylpyruvate tautomerase PptA (4-oxalocrotonate tautomerase family)
VPLIIIHSLHPNETDATAIPRMITDVRDAGARALGCPVANIWVMFHALPPGHYLQGDAAPATVPDATTHPPCVIVRAQVGRTPRERDAFVAAVAAAVGRGLAVPAEHVWIYYDEMRSEDVWFNGRWSA